MSPDVLYMMAKQPLVFPCRVTHPNVTAVTLVKVSEVSLSLSLSPVTPQHILCTSPPPQQPPTTTRPSSLQILFANIVLRLGSRGAVACVSICLRPSADTCESVCGCVCERRCLSAE